MKNFMNKISRLSLAMIGNSILVTTAVGLVVCAVSLTALYLIKYVNNDTPEMIKLQCAIGIDRPDCIDHQKEINDLEAERERLR